MGRGEVGEPRMAGRGGARGLVGERGVVGVGTEEGVEVEDDGALIRAGFMASGWGLHPYRLEEEDSEEEIGQRKKQHTNTNRQTEK